MSQLVRHPDQLAEEDGDGYDVAASAAPAAPCTAAAGDRGAEDSYDFPLRTDIASPPVMFPGLRAPQAPHAWVPWPGRPVESYRIPLT